MTVSWEYLFVNVDNEICNDGTYIENIPDPKNHSSNLRCEVTFSLSKEDGKYVCTNANELKSYVRSVEKNIRVERYINANGVELSAGSWDFISGDFFGSEVWTVDGENCMTDPHLDAIECLMALINM